MKRFALRCLLFLLLGAILSVTVAWANALWRHTHGGQLWSGPPIEAFSWDRGLDDPNTSTIITDYKWGFGLDDVQMLSLPKAANRVTLNQDESTFSIATFGQRHLYIAGWPARCLSGYWDTPSAPRQAIEAPKWLNPRVSDRGEARLLPCAPVWPGFAINTIFYAAILWLLFTLPGVPFALRRTRRIRRGLCPKCGYDLRGGNHAACPECGKAVMRQ